LANLN